MPARNPAAFVAEQQFLGLGNTGNPIFGLPQKILQQFSRGQLDLLRRRGGLFPVHEHQAWPQGLFRHPSGNKSEVNRFLHIACTQQETTAIRT